MAYLWRKVIGSTAECPCSRFARFCEPKVSNFDVPVEIQQDVFRFEISIDDILGVQMVKGERDFCSVEFGNRFRKSLYK